MSDIRKHNAIRVQWWLESYGNRFPSGPQEILRVENRKLLGTVPINKALGTVLEDEDLLYSDRVMLTLIFGDGFSGMRKSRPDLFGALFTTYLSAHFSIADLDRYGVRAAAGDEEAADLLIRVFEARGWLLHELEKWFDPGSIEVGHWLHVEKAERARSPREAATQDQIELAAAAHRGMVRDFEALKKAEPHLKEREAQRRIANKWGVTDRTVRNALRKGRPQE